MVEVFSDFETKQALVHSHTIGFYLPYPVHSLFLILFYSMCTLKFNLKLTWFGLILGLSCIDVILR